MLHLLRLSRLLLAVILGTAAQNEHPVRLGRIHILEWFISVDDVVLQ